MADDSVVHATAAMAAATLGDRRRAALVAACSGRAIGAAASQASAGGGAAGGGAGGPVLVDVEQLSYPKADLRSSDGACNFFVHIDIRTKRRSWDTEDENTTNVENIVTETGETPDMVRSWLMKLRNNSGKAVNRFMVVHGFFDPRRSKKWLGEVVNEDKIGLIQTNRIVNARRKAGQLTDQVYELWKVGESLKEEEKRDKLKEKIRTALQKTELFFSPKDKGVRVRVGKDIRAKLFVLVDCLAMFGGADTAWNWAWDADGKDKDLGRGTRVMSTGDASE